MTAPRTAHPHATPARFASRLTAVPALIAAACAVALAVIVGRDRGPSIPPPNQDDLRREFALRLQAHSPTRAADDHNGSR